MIDLLKALQKQSNNVYEIGITSPDGKEFTYTIKYKPIAKRFKKVKSIELNIVKYTYDYEIKLHLIETYNNGEKQSKHFNLVQVFVRDEYQRIELIRPKPNQYKLIKYFIKLILEKAKWVTLQ